MRHRIIHGSGTAAAVCLASFLASLWCGQVAAQTTAFTYQGQLRENGAIPPDTNTYDLQFRVIDDLNVQQGPTLCFDNVALAGGLFTVSLDFGNVFTGAPRHLEIGVRPGGALADCSLNPGTYTILAPNQTITSAPYSVMSVDSSTLGGMGGAYYRNATNINAGTLADVRLSSNVALLNNSQTFTGAKAFSTAPSFTAAGAPMSVSSISLVSNLNADLLDGQHGSYYQNSGNQNAGTLSDSRLSSNVALLNAVQTFTANKTFSSGNPITINDTTSGGYAFEVNNSGGTSVWIDNDATASGLIAYGISLDVEGTTTRYGMVNDVLGTTGTGYNVWSTNASPAGRGYYASMTGTGTTYGVYVSNNSTDGYGGYFNNTATSGTTYGLYCENNSTDGYGLYALHDASTGTGPAIYGRSDSTSSNAFAIHGRMNSASASTSSAAVRGENAGAGRGVWGSVEGEGEGVYGATVDGEGVYGIASPTTTSEICYGGYFSGGNSDSSRGVYGTVSGGGIGVYGYSSGGYGGYFDTGVGGGAALYVVGTASVGVITIRGGADLAENFEVATRPEDVKPGMLVMIDADNPGGVTLARGAYNKCVAGVVSGAKELQAGMILGHFDDQKDARPVALTGRVWTYVDAGGEDVEPGDLLTTSDTPGYAMKATDLARAQGAVIGKAMSRLAKGEKGLVLVLINLQ